ncbi:hypothetical protein [Lentibacillus cibarius]|uniref:Uncharacterized protein n=1 Tax=Lentibacillus cibarius TaxID=2583219 RepID=A0A5S3QIZ4_9BACI|nr:hypothetical protein [Lentibacillus cibarius]TMN21902.1 hypothetical protein FFL34_07080 [Lentibacillus cibarius]
MGEGTASVEIYYGSVKVDSVEVTVNDSTPSLSSLELKEVEEISTTDGTSTAQEFVLSDAFTVESGAVVGATLSGSSEDVKLDLDDKVLYVESGSEEAEFNNNDGDDIKLADISLALDFTTNDTTYTDGLDLEAGDKGNIVLKVTPVGETNPVATQVITVDIPVGS